MAKRPLKQANPDQQTTLMKRRNLLLTILWAFVFVVAVSYGYLQGYPLVAAGQTMQGIMTGLAYGVGSLLAILAALFINRKLRGL